MPRRRGSTKTSPAPAVARKPRGGKKTGPETQPGANDSAPASPDVKKEAKTTKRKIAASISPPAKRQKTTTTNPTETVIATSEPSPTNPETPQNTGVFPHKENARPQFRILPETPTRAVSKVTDNTLHDMQDGDSDLDLQPMAVHGSGNRRLKAEIARLKSQIKKDPKELVSNNMTNPESAPGMTPEVTSTEMTADNASQKDKDKHGDVPAAANDNAKVNQVFEIPKGRMLVYKADYATLMRRTITVNKMVMTFTKSTCYVKDKNGGKKNLALTDLLAEARSLSFGVQSLTNAITKLPVTKKGESSTSAGDISGAQKTVVEEKIPMATEKPATVENDGDVTVTQVAERPVGGGLVSEPIPVEKPGHGKEDTGNDLPTPTKRIVIKVSKPM